MDNQILESQIAEQLEPEIPKIVDKPINLPDSDYTPPMIFTTKKAKSKISNHLNFLKKLTEI